MGGLLVQFLGLFALLGIATWGYRHWISPRQVGIQGKGMLLLCVVTLVGGLLGSTGWWIDDPRSFSWDLPPLAGRMLASAGWAFGVATLAALHRPVPHRTRLVMLMLAVYLAPLLVTAPLFHLERFDPAAPITYVFFALVLTMTVAALWYLYRQPVIVPNEPADSLAPTALVGRWLGLVAAVSATLALPTWRSSRAPRCGAGHELRLRKRSNASPASDTPAICAARAKVMRRWIPLRKAWVSLRCGNGLSGSSTPRKSHRGPQPSFIS